MKQEERLIRTKLFKFVLYLWVSVITGVVLWGVIGEQILSYFISFSVVFGLFFYLHKRGVRSDEHNKR